MSNAYYVSKVDPRITVSTLKIFKSVLTGDMKKDLKTLSTAFRVYHLSQKEWERVILEAINA